MKLNQLIRTILNLLGIYTIFTTIVAAGMSFIIIPFTMINQGMNGLGWPALMALFQFCLPFLIGVLLVWKSRKIAELILKYSGVDHECGTERIEIKEFPYVSFSLLGLYMLSQTLPKLCQFIAYLFQQKVNEISYLSLSEGNFLENHLQNVVYHGVAVGFSFFVFMKGKSFGKLILGVRKEANQPE